MKQGILVTAYKHPEWLRRVVDLLGSDFSFFIHIDRNTSSRDQERFRQLGRSHGNVIFVSNRYKVNWGGFNHLQAILLLSERALESGMEYCHLITGQDYPVKSASYFGQDLATENSYIEYFEIPSVYWKGGFDRMTLFHLNDVFNRRTIGGKTALIMLTAIQRLFRVERSLPENVKLYGGGTYWSLNRACLEYVVDYTKRNPSFLFHFRHTFCPEEILFQTVLLNSPFRGNLVNDNLRYIRWEKRYGSYPAILDSSDVGSILSSAALFARKVAYPESQELVDKIDRAVHFAGLAQFNPTHS